MAKYVVESAVKKRFHDDGIRVRREVFDALDRAVDAIIDTAVAQSKRFGSVRATEIDLAANHAGREFVNSRGRR